jgi:hypothetical protein
MDAEDSGVVSDGLCGSSIFLQVRLVMAFGAGLWGLFLKG